MVHSGYTPSPSPTPFPSILHSSHKTSLLLLLCALLCDSGFNQGCSTKHERQVSTQAGVTYSDFNTKDNGFSPSEALDKIEHPEPLPSMAGCLAVTCPITQLQLLQVHECYAHMMTQDNAS